MHFRTKAIHLANTNDSTRAIIPPLYLSNTYVLPDSEHRGEYVYSRVGSPTRNALENYIAVLESGFGALAFPSGTSAAQCVALLCKKGDHVILGTDIYAGTYTLFCDSSERIQATLTCVPSNHLESLAAAITPATKLIWIESPGNPLLSVTDIRACAKLARKHSILLAVDSTLATPALTRPIELGADIVVHSASKYIGGHSDLLGGIIIAREEKTLERLRRIQTLTGAILGPLECYLCHRGLKTLELRVLEQSRTALKIAQFLQDHKMVRKVYYPGLVSHPNHQVAKRQMQGGYGGLLSFEIVGREDQAKKIIESTTIIQLAMSLGGVESLITHPASMTHASYGRRERKHRGISDTLIRVSVGLEAFEDLRDDLEQALSS